jgi:hypothetical protein
VRQRAAGNGVTAQEGRGEEHVSEERRFRPRVGGSTAEPVPERETRSGRDRGSGSGFCQSPLGAAGFGFFSAGFESPFDGDSPDEEPDSAPDSPPFFSFFPLP